MWLKRRFKTEIEKIDIEKLEVKKKNDTNFMKKTVLNSKISAHLITKLVCK